MNMSLFDQVVNESYSADLGGHTEEKLDSATESYIDGIITDDAATMVAYTSECMMGMMALEAAEARMEGMMAVKFMNARQAGDQAAMEQAVVAMEGFIGNVWETLKEMIKKAYTAVKNFLLKAWDKMKGYANIVKAMFTKYGDVLRHKNCSGCEVKWEKINIEAAHDVYVKRSAQIDKVIDEITNGAKAELQVREVNPNYKHDAVSHGNIQGQGVQGRLNVSRMGDRRYSTMADKSDSIPSPKEIIDDLNKVVYPERNGSPNDPEEKVDFEQHRNDILEAADISSYKKYIDHFMSLGTKGYQEDIKAIEEIKRELAKVRGSAEAAGIGSFHSRVRVALNAKLHLIQVCSRVMKEAASHRQSLAVSACRKAIMYHATTGNGRSSTEESYDASNNYFDNLMSAYGF